MATSIGEDVRAINAVIARQFDSLNWTCGSSADWETFAADFIAGASLYPAARPVQPRTVEDFIARMKSLSESKLRSFREAVLGTEVHVFGNVAVAVAACEMTENDVGMNRGVEMLLLIRNEDARKIVAQAWDTESPSKPIPTNLLPGAGSD
jgi:hypothetical protein